MVFKRIRDIDGKMVKSIQIKTDGGGLESMTAELCDSAEEIEKRPGLFGWRIKRHGVDNFYPYHSIYRVVYANEQAVVADEDKIETDSGAKADAIKQAPSATQSLKTFR
jgi:hypothetical protein